MSIKSAQIKTTTKNIINFSQPPTLAYNLVLLLQNNIIIIKYFCYPPAGTPHPPLN